MMNITPQAPNLSIPTVLNPHTESLRRENNQREIITKPAPTNQSAAEKGVASDRERSRTPAQNNANIDFSSISEQAKLANTSIAEQGQNQEDTRGSKNSPQESQTGQEGQEQHSSTDAAEQTRAQELAHNQIINELKKRDQEVHAHEAAHASVGGTFTGPPNFSYEKGPDGQRYAVEGDVSVDLSSVPGDPRATIAKMQKVHAAALAPVHPSIQDTRVANTATQLILQAQSELAASKQDEIQALNRDQEGDESSAIGGTTEASQINSSANFEALITRTLDNQEKIAPSQSEAVIQRALRIESFYLDISQAYDKPARFQFELTA